VADAAIILNASVLCPRRRPKTNRMSKAFPPIGMVPRKGPRGRAGVPQLRPASLVCFHFIRSSYLHHVGPERLSILTMCLLCSWTVFCGNVINSSDSFDPASSSVVSAPNTPREIHRLCRMNLFHHRSARASAFQSVVEPAPFFSTTDYLKFENSMKVIVGISTLNMCDGYCPGTSQQSHATATPDALTYFLLPRYGWRSSHAGSSARIHANTTAYHHGCGICFLTWARTKMEDIMQPTLHTLTARTHLAASATLQGGQ